MRYSFVLLGAASLVPAALADRGSGTNVEPTVCNNVPDVMPVSMPTAAPICDHAADPDGAMGLCPNLADGGWCDCGSAGDFSMLPDGNLCAYSSLPASTLALTTTDCVSSTEFAAETVTISVVPVPVNSSVAQRRAVTMPLSGTTAERRRAAVRLSKRGGTVSYAASCDDPPPSSSNYGPKNGFNSMTDVLNAAYSDAVALATVSQNVDAGSKGFTHYFGGTKPDVQLDHFNKMMAAIASNNENYDIQFVCGAGETNDCRKGSVMVTDATTGSGTKNIQVCPSFWTAPSTKYLLYRSDKTSPTPPYRNNDAGGWCAKNGDNSQQLNQYFATAGTTVLHELTHLDSLGAMVGLDADGNNQHGTDDFQTGCELDGARAYLGTYQEDDTLASPDYNAESYAAAATEIYFMDLCGFTEVQPLVQ